MSAPRPVAILCITPAINPPFIINVQQPLDILAQKGALSYTARTEQEISFRNLQNHDAVLFFRNSSPASLKWLYFSKLLGKAVIYGVDDNLFDLSLSERGKGLDPLCLNAHERYIKKADLVLVYSNPMLEKASSCNPNVVKVKPGIDLSLVKSSPPKGVDEKIKIVYATSRYNSDILSEIFFPAIKRALIEYDGRVEMDFWGYLPEEFKGFPGVNLVPAMDYNSYLAELSTKGFDIGLAPLKDDMFHRSKTNTKFRDYGACGIAGIYTEVDVYSDCVEDGVTGLLVKNTKEDWYGAIKRLIDDAPLREAIKKNACGYVKKNYDMERVADDLLDVITQLVAGCKAKKHSLWLNASFPKGVFRHFTELNTPLINFFSVDKDDPLIADLREISRYYNYPVRVRRLDTSLSRRMAVNPKRYLPSHEVSIIGKIPKRFGLEVSEAARGLSNRPILVHELADTSKEALVNLIEDLFYEKCIMEQKHQYFYSSGIIKAYLYTYRRIVSLYLFKRTGLNSLESKFRRRYLKPFKRQLRVMFDRWHGKIR